jgi:uncharacterized membrane protein
VADNDNAQNEGGGVLESVKDSTKDVAKDATQTVTGEMKKVAREAAIVVLTPVVKKAATSLTKQLATKGPELFQEYVEPRIEEAGGIGNLAKDLTGSKGLKGMAVGKAAESMMGKVTGKGGSGGKADGTGRGRRLPIQESIDVGVPIDVAYNEWTQFEDFPEFMHRVEQIEQIDDTHLVWHENIWGRRRTWKAEITDQTPNERIAWRSEDGVENVGVITFHDMGDRLTRILVNLDFQPKGLMEKTASGFRMSRRALRSDLMRFKAHIEMQDEEEGAWRGTIEDGEVTDYDEDYENPRDAGEDGDDQSDEYEDEQDEPEDQSDEYEDDEEEDEDEPDEQSDEYEDDEEEDEDEPDEQSDEYEDDEEDDQSDEDGSDEDDEGLTAGPARRGRSRARSAAKKASRPARKRPSSAGRTAKKSSSPARKRTSAAAKKTSSTAKKATGPARKRASGTARKTSGTAKRSSGPARKTSSTARKTAAASGRRTSSTAKKTAGPAKKTAGTAKKTAKKSTGPARKRASSTTKKSSAPARKRATSKRSASPRRRSSR